MGEQSQDMRYLTWSRRAAFSLSFGFTLSLFGLVLAACDDAPDPFDPGASGHEALARRYGDAFVAGDLVALETLLADELVHHDGVQTRDRTSILQSAENLARGFPGATGEIEVSMAQDDLAALRFRLRGRQEGPFMVFGPFGIPQSIPPQGAAVDFVGMDILRIEGPRIVEVWSTVDTTALYRSLLAPVVAPAPSERLPAEIIAELSPGLFLEGITALPEGGYVVTVVGFTDPSESRLLMLDGQGAVTDLTMWTHPDAQLGTVTRNHDALFATVNAPRTPEDHGVWRFDRQGSGGPWVVLPPDVVPNGITVGPDGALYVADSNQGGVWRVDAETRVATPFIVHPLLSAKAILAAYPASNGLTFHEMDLFVSVSDTGRIIRIPVTMSDPAVGLVAGHPVLFAEGTPADGIAVDAAGHLYATTHPHNQLIRVAPDGTRTLVAGLAEGMNGPTDLFFDAASGDLVVVTDGRLFESLIAPVAIEAPKVVRISTERVP